MNRYQYKAIELCYLRDTSMSNSEVARRLSVSLETVKRWRYKRKIHYKYPYKRVHPSILELCNHLSIREVSRQSGISRHIIAHALKQREQ
jgi:transposase